MKHVGKIRFFGDTSVGDPYPKPNSHVFRHPGTGSISQRYGSGAGSGSYSYKGVERTLYF